MVDFSESQPRLKIIRDKTIWNPATRKVHQYEFTVIHSSSPSKKSPAGNPHVTNQRSFPPSCRCLLRPVPQFLSFKFVFLFRQSPSFVCSPTSISIRLLKKNLSPVRHFFVDKFLRANWYKWNFQVGFDARKLHSDRLWNSYPTLLRPVNIRL